MAIVNIEDMAQYGLAWSWANKVFSGSGDF